MIGSTKVSSQFFEIFLIALSNMVKSFSYYLYHTHTIIADQTNMTHLANLVKILYLNLHLSHGARKECY